MTFSELLLHWYDAHRRSLPWRGARDPYAIWLSEIILQQTLSEMVAGSEGWMSEDYSPFMVDVENQVVLSFGQGTVSTFQIGRAHV